MIPSNFMGWVRFLLGKYLGRDSEQNKAATKGDTLPSEEKDGDSPRLKTSVEKQAQPLTILVGFFRILVPHDVSTNQIIMGTIFLIIAGLVFVLTIILVAQLEQSDRPENLTNRPVKAVTGHDSN